MTPDAVPERQGQSSEKTVAQTRLPGPVPGVSRGVEPREPGGSQDSNLANGSLSAEDQAMG
jgi:hypothetical protein